MAILKMYFWTISKDPAYGVDSFVCYIGILLLSCIKRIKG